MTKEIDIELSFINKLSDLKYTYRTDIRTNESLENNFREKFEALNKVKLTDSEFEKLKTEIIKADVFAASKMLRQVNTLIRDDGSSLHYTLVNIKDWCKNEYEVINQLRMNTQKSNHRYDVIILINGIPISQVELKTLEISPRVAIQQIVDYKKDLGNRYTNSLLCFIQMFIVSNRSNTYYFANNNNHHFNFNADEQFLPIYQFADEKNKKITNLDLFSDRFLSKCTFGEMINKYMVLVECEQKILVMRPYQIYAVKAIVNCIHQNRGNGYIWHTTGSGKTLTSFKASTLLKDNPDIDKCLFVVDRKDLDRQTREEFNKFQEGSVEENTNTESLVKRMLSDDYADKVIVTTIQKLGLALDPTNKKNYKEKLEKISNKRIVFIFDECHRSQFGENHKAIKEYFPNAQLFGFTGTPIFQENSNYTKVDGKNASYVTTEDIFQQELHAYTITNAIDDLNVLRFHIDYFKPKKQVKTSTKKHQSAVVDTILEKHNTATSDRKFNAIFATASINEAIDYYKLFNSKQELKQKENSDYKPLNITCVFSPPSEGNKDIKQYQEDLEQEKFDNKQSPEEKKKALSEIIKDYNLKFKTNHSINEFDLYYQDVQKRIKDHKYSNSDYSHNNKIDITIVVDMLLTGFDSKFLNTLYVDKNLRYHNLIQAFSRTNRILNDTKKKGNILDFRQQEDAINNAIALFSGENLNKAKEIWFVDPAPKVIEKYKKAVETLSKFMKSQDLECKAEEVNNLKGNKAKINFLTHFKEVQRLKIQLDQYTDITKEQEEVIEKLIPNEELRSFKSAYLDTAKKFKDTQGNKKKGDDSSQQEIDFEFVLFSSAIIDYDYILGLIAKYSQNNASKQKMTKEQLINILCSSSNLLEEREDIIDYINSLDPSKGLTIDQVKKGYDLFKKEKINRIIKEIAEKHNLPNDSLKSFMEDILSRKIFDGEKLIDLLEPLDLGWKARTQKELALMEDLVPQLNKLANGREISGLAAYE